MATETISAEDFIPVEKSGPMVAYALPADLVRVTVSYITCGRGVLDRIAREGRYVQLAYSPKHEALMLKGVDDPKRGFKMKVAASKSATFCIPRRLKDLRVPRGDYLPLEGSENVYKLVNKK